MYVEARSLAHTAIKNMPYRWERDAFRQRTEINDDISVVPQVNLFNSRGNTSAPNHGSIVSKDLDGLERDVMQDSAEALNIRFSLCNKRRGWIGAFFAKKDPRYSRRDALRQCPAYNCGAWVETRAS